MTLHSDFKTTFSSIFNKNEQFFLIAGPCAVENRDLLFEIAEKVKEITQELGIPYIFKASYKKANRSRLDSFTGIGDELAMTYLKEIREKLDLPITTDVHSVAEATWAGQWVDVIQIPAFLCRQTELLVAAAKTGKVVNIKKGQFLAPAAMQFAIDKVRQSGNDLVLATERGTTFGFQDMVVDFRGIPEMQSFQVPVVLDCTHSLQQPNQASGVTGGKPALIETIAKAGIATGVNGLFIETHPRPSEALSDGANMLPLDQLKPLLEKLVKIRAAVV